MKKLLLLIFITSLIFYSCDYFKLQSYKEWQKTSDIDTDVDVFIGGFNYDGSDYSPCYWKNGVAVSLGSYNCAALPVVYSIALDVEDIYCGGSYYNGTVLNACYWKNGKQVLVELDNTTQTSEIYSIAVAGGTVFACGFERNGSHNKACFWINGKKYSLPDPGTGDSYGRAIVVDKETYDFYIAGYYSTTNAHACYWKNGSECITLPTPYTGESLANTIALSNGKIYCGGRSYNGNNIPCYWVDGKCIELPYTASGTIFGMTVYDGSVYCTGRESNYTALWKDTSLLWSDTSLANGYGRGVAVYDNDVYVAGYASSIPYLWKNGNSTVLPYSTQGQALCVVVRAKR